MIQCDVDVTVVYSNQFVSAAVVSVYTVVRHVCGCSGSVYARHTDDVMMLNSSSTTWMWNLFKDAANYSSASNASLSMDDLVELIDGRLRVIPSYAATAIALLVLATNSGTLVALSGTLGAATLNANLRLVLSLTLADMLVALSVLLTVNVQLPSVVDSEPGTCARLCLQGLQMSAHTVSLFSLLGLAVDHYHAICRPLQYSSTMRYRSVIIAIVSAWFVSTAVGFSDLFLPFGDCSYVLTSASYCQRAWCSTYEPHYVMMALAGLLLVIIAVIYSFIYASVRRYRGAAGAVATVLSNSSGRRLLRRHLKGLYTTLAIVGSFVVCWLPYCLFISVISVLMHADQDGDETARLFRIHRRFYLYLYDLVLLNGVADPFIYAVRMREVRRGYRRAVARLLCRPVARASACHETASRSRRSCDSTTPTTSKATGGSGRAVTPRLSSTARCGVVLVNPRSTVMECIELRELQGGRRDYSCLRTTVADVNITTVRRDVDDDMSTS